MATTTFAHLADLLEQRHAFTSRWLGYAIEAGILRDKGMRASGIGVSYREYEYPDSVSQEELLDAIISCAKLNAQPEDDSPPLRLKKKKRS